ncbi:MAG TPA: MFS transporter [Gaiellaceae bacterium]
MAHWLRDRGYEAYAVTGGVHALLGTPLPEPEPVSTGRRQEWKAGAAALRHRRFQIYFAGVMLSLTGSWVEAGAFGYVVLLLGGSAATLGVIGFLNTIPNLVFALPAGVLADHFDRRKILLLFQGGNMGVAIALAVLWASGELTVFLMGVLAFIGGTLGTLSFPAFQSMLASTVPEEDLESAVALNSLSLQVARFVGPAIAGILLASAGPTWVFGVNAVSFLAVLGALALLPSSRARIAAASAGVRGAMADGLRYVFGQRSLASLMVLMVFAGMFATPPVAFMVPGLVRFQLHEGPRTLGLLISLIGLGSVFGSVALLALSRRANKGEPGLVCYLVCAAAIALIGISTSVPLSLALALVGGFTGVIFIGLSTVVVQAASSEEMRSRAMAIWAAAFVGVLPIGALITAGLAAWLGAGGAVAVDGVITLAGGLGVLLWRPEVRWLGCAALPAACVAATDPAAYALAEELEASRAA